jgi:VWFA-related protein
MHGEDTVASMNRFRIHWPGLLAACALFLGIPETAQNLRVDVLLQQVVATVRDSDSKLVTNLNAEDFVIMLEGVRQPIRHFTQDEDVPFSVGLIIDASESMNAALASAQGAAATFIRGMRSQDESFLMTFDSNSTLRQEFTTEPQKLFSALRGVTIGAGTSLIDAVKQAVGKLHQSRNSKRALILISDGGDTSAWETDVKAFHETVSGMETLIYAVQIQDAKEADRLARIAATSGSIGRTGRGEADPDNPGEAENAGPPQRQTQDMSRVGPKTAEMIAGKAPAAYRPALAKRLMQGMADESAARYFYIDSNTQPDELVRQVSSTFDEIFTELRGQYTIGFYPPLSSKPLNRLRVLTPKYRYRIRTITTRLPSPKH